MRWYEYKMEVDDLTAPDDLKAKLLAMTDTLTAEEKAEPMMAAPAPQTAAPAAPLNTEAKKKKPIHFPVKQLGTLAACLAVCVLGYSTLHLGIGMGSAKSSAPTESAISLNLLKSISLEYALAPQIIIFGFTIFAISCTLS